MARNAFFSAALTPWVALCAFTRFLSNIFIRDAIKRADSIHGHANLVRTSRGAIIERIDYFVLANAGFKSVKI